MEPSPEHTFKLLVVGERGTGKTCLIRRYVNNEFEPHTRATIGVDFALKTLRTEHGDVTLHLWDIAGQERYGQLTRAYYQTAVGALVLYDVTRTATFEAVAHWKADLDEKVKLPGDASLPCVLVANKADLAAQQSATDLDTYCREHGFCGWVLTSCKEGRGVDSAFAMLLERVLANALPVYKPPISSTLRMSVSSAKRSF
eukprot:TRINITY_DN21728_c0_g1_i1.p1 TRINITY_DN21728_c0_g1~~TRINITY_DN21728_c0_g1_i1.p1  ORF type:complete len:200 (+),score=26.63 TRINITY_DN21728_c0_g1_i1:162-761(+)